MQSVRNESFPWRRVRKAIGMFVPKRYRRCKLCGGAFEHGVVFVDGGFVTEAVCEPCYVRVHEDEMMADRSRAPERVSA